MFLIASGHKEDGRSHHHPEHPGEEKVMPSPIPVVEIHGLILAYSERLG